MQICLSETVTGLRAIQTSPVSETLFTDSGARLQLIVEWPVSLACSAGGGRLHKYVMQLSDWKVLMDRHIDFFPHTKYLLLFGRDSLYHTWTNQSQAALTSVQSSASSYCSLEEMVITFQFLFSVSQWLLDQVGVDSLCPYAMSFDSFSPQKAVKTWDSWSRNSISGALTCGNGTLMLFFLLQGHLLIHSLFVCSRTLVLHINLVNFRTMSGCVFSYL